MRYQGVVPAPARSPSRTLRSITRPGARRTNDHQGFLGAQILRRGVLGVGLRPGRAGGEAAGVDLFLRQQALVVEALDPGRLGVGLVGQDGLLGGQSGLLGQLGAQQGVVEVGQRLAGGDPGPHIDQHLGHAKAGELGENGGVFARNERARRHQAALDQARRHGHHADRPRLLTRALDGLFLAAAQGSGGDQRQGDGEAGVEFRHDGISHRDLAPDAAKAHPPPSAL